MYLFAFCTTHQKVKPDKGLRYLDIAQGRISLRGNQYLDYNFIKLH
jgi:hypothetical protein